jgi:hypothetical protein
MKPPLRTKSVGTRVSDAELRVLKSRAAAAGLMSSEWVRDVLLASSVEVGTMAAERTTLAEIWAFRPCSSWQRADRYQTKQQRMVALIQSNQRCAFGIPGFDKPRVPDAPGDR